MPRPVRVRFAPSPTGDLHVGGARTALYNYLFARSQNGKFVLRVEDTDTERSTEEFLRRQLEDLKWLGLCWDEGVDSGSLESTGESGPYRQSERLPVYRKYGQRLLEKGLAYYDFRSELELERLKQENSQKFNPIPRPEPLIDPEEAQRRIQKGEKAALRFKVEKSGDHFIKDLVRGEVRLPEDRITDFIIIRSNLMPVYNFCCAIDDALMGISHILRAEEHLINSVRQKMIHEALGFDPPCFVHLSLVLGKDRQKLSKRHGTTSCRQYRERGYLPEALLNFVALLGWSPGGDREVMSLDELIEKFDISGLNPSGAVFDEEKFQWMNSVHLRQLSNERLWSLLKPLFEKKNICLPENREFIERVLNVFKEKMETLNDAPALLSPIDDEFFEISDEAQSVLQWETSSKVLLAWRTQVEKMNSQFMTKEEFRQIQDHIKIRAAVNGKQLFMPIRVAVIGQPQGVDLQSLVPLIARESLLKRVEKVINQPLSQRRSSQ